MMATSKKAILLVLFSTLINAVAQLSYKFGVKNFTSNIIDVIVNPPLLAGLCLYGVSAVILVTALKSGELSVLYPIVATGYVWVNLLSMHFLGEPMNMFKWLGVASIILGVTAIGVGSEK